MQKFAMSDTVPLGTWINVTWILKSRSNNICCCYIWMTPSPFPTLRPPDKLTLCHHKHPPSRHFLLLWWRLTIKQVLSTLIFKIQVGVAEYQRMEGGDIDSESLQAVRNLKSKFEKLAMKTSTQGTPRLNTNGDTLVATAPSSPRPRATSSSESNALPMEGFHLRASSSSSDLSVSAKRAVPPPPPPRGSKFLSPSPTHSPVASPLLRPVPPPPILAQDVNSPPNVAVLKDILCVLCLLHIWSSD